MANSLGIEPRLARCRQLAAALPDARSGSNTQYSIQDAAACALATFCFLAPSCLDYQRRRLQDSARSNCQSLCAIAELPGDHQMRNLLDGHAPAHCDERFHAGLDRLRDHGGLGALLRLDGRLLIALDGMQFHGSDAIHCPQCSVRPVGQHNTEQCFHAMLAASVVAAGQAHVLPLPPQFVQPQQDPAANQPALSATERKQDCERNAAKRWLPAQLPKLGPYRPVLRGDDLDCCQPLCQPVQDLGADFLCVCQPSSHKTVYKLLPQRRIGSTDWIRVRHPDRQIESHRYQWRNQVPVRSGAEALRGTWVDCQIQRKGKLSEHNAFCTSLTVNPDNVAESARAGRARWKIENENCNVLSQHGDALKHNCGHGRKGLANLLATLHLCAFALHSILDRVCELWRHCRAQAGTRRRGCERLRVLAERVWFEDWIALLATTCARRRLVPVPI